jgi:hypothetical protein
LTEVARGAGAGMIFDIYENFYCFHFYYYDMMTTPSPPSKAPGSHLRVVRVNVHLTVREVKQPPCGMDH